MMRILNLPSLLLPSWDSSSRWSTHLPPGNSTLVAEGSGESGEALTDAAGVMAGPAAVHAEGAWLGAAVAIEPRGADWG